MKNKYIILIIVVLTTFGLKAQQWGEYTFYSVQNSTTAYLVDTNGSNFHTWTFSSSARTGYTTYLLPGGTVLRSVMHSPNSFSGGGVTGGLQKTDWNGNVLWDYVYSSSTECMHHDICPMPNGNVLLISYDSKTASEVSQAGCSQSISMWPEKIVEIQQTGPTTGTEVWAWYLWDHLVQNIDSTKSNYQTSISAHPELLNINYNITKDFMHANGIDYNPQLDQIVFSSHYLNEFYVIDHSTTTAEAATHAGGNSGKGGDFLYRWGNPSAYGVAGSTNFNVIHDAHFIPDDCPHAGYIGGFNNDGISGSQSCIDMVNPPRNGYNYNITPGTANLPAAYDWRHACNGHSGHMGSSQELPNGNMLVCIAQSGSIYEIDSAQNVLWTKNASGTTCNAMRYDACYVSGTPPAAPVISQSGDTLISTVGVNYVWYFNGIADTSVNSMMYLPVQSGDYTVQVIDSNGCHSQPSAPFTYIPTGLPDLNKGEVNIFPNPTNGIVAISGIKDNSREFRILVSDQQGRKVSERKFSNIIDLSDIDKGVYFISVLDNNSVISRNRIVVIR